MPLLPAAAMRRSGSSTSAGAADRKTRGIVFDSQEAGMARIAKPVAFPLPVTPASHAGDMTCRATAVESLAFSMPGTPVALTSTPASLPLRFLAAEGQEPRRSAYGSCTPAVALRGVRRTSLVAVQPSSLAIKACLTPRQRAEEDLPRGYPARSAAFVPSVRTFSHKSTKSAPLQSWRRVTFAPSADNSLVEMTPYGQIYGAHPNDLDFDTETMQLQPIVYPATSPMAAETMQLQPIVYPAPSSVSSGIGCFPEQTPVNGYGMPV